MMFKCESCGEYFGEERLSKYEEDWCCPYCGSEGCVEAKQCKLCGEPTMEDYCEDCEKDLKRRFQNLLADNFTIEEKEALNKIYEGWEF